MDYDYKGVDRKGKRVEGRLSAASEGELRMALRSLGIRPTQVSKAASMSVKVTSALKGGIRNVPTEVLVIFTRQLQLLVNSGVPLVQGLEILREQTQHSTFREVIKNIKEQVSQGAYLWESLAAYPQIFPKLYVSLIRAGEVSGSIDSMLKRLATYLENGDKIRKMVKGAMMYPIIVFAVGGGVIALMLIFVIPKFEEMLKGANQELPAVTKFVIDASHFLVSNFPILAGSIGVSIYLLIRYSKTKEGKAILDRIIFNLPLFGPITQKSSISRFCRTLQTLLTSGVNLIDAIDICRSALDNSVIEEAVGKIRREIEAGKTLGMVITQMTVFPKMAVQMISVGEATGSLDKMLEKVADFYDTEVEALVAGISKLIEPFILVFLGVVVGGMMVAMYMPVFKLAGGAN